MSQSVLRVVGLGEAPLDAAAVFHARYLGEAKAALAQADALVLVFARAGHEHRGWRIAVVQELAREAAPKRVNGVVGDEPDAIDLTIAWLAKTPGITGQILPVDGKTGEID